MQHAPPTSANVNPFATPTHTLPRPAACVLTPAACRAPSHAALTGTTAPLTTIATTMMTDTQNDMTTDTMSDTTTDATAGATTAITMATPNVTTTDTTTATPSPLAARSAVATTLLPPSQMTRTIRAASHTRRHLAGRVRASQQEPTRKRKTPSSTTWAKLHSSLA